VVERFAPVLGGRHQDPEVLADALLADDIFEPARPQAQVVRIVGAALGRNDARSDLGHAAIIQVASGECEFSVGAAPL
jgi:hypothetical protein